MPERRLLKIKVCGMKEAGNIEGVGHLNPDFMGFIFYDRSPRNAIGMPVEALDNFSEEIRKVGVFVDSNPDYIEEIAGKYGIDALQLHGNESPELCGLLKDKGFFVIKAFGIEAAGVSIDEEIIKPYEGKIDMVLFDTKTLARGGSGKKFDWKALDNYSLQIPFLLSGGIDICDADAIRGLTNPFLAGIDVNSRFELSPGIKDVEKLDEFIKRIG